MSALSSESTRRPDCRTYDEPLYAAFLRKYPEVSRPYREELLDAERESANEVLQKMLSTTVSHGVVFAKHMGRHCMEDLDPNLLAAPGSRHVILIRNPLELIMSWNVKGAVHNESDLSNVTNLHELVGIYLKIRKLTGAAPVIVDMDALKREPERILRALCVSLNIPFYSEQLSWPAGPKPGIDGMWALHWYDGVHKSKGFYSESSAGKEDKGTYRPSAYSALSPEQLQAYREVIPFYEMLQHQAVGLDVLCRGITHCPRDVDSNEESLGGPIIDHGKTVAGSGRPVSFTLTDPRNADVLIWVGDRLVPREYARVSVFDSSVQGGDAVWEGMRVYDGRVFKMEEHLDRLFDSAHAMNYNGVPSREYIRESIFNTLRANGMMTETHMRVTLSRGTKVTSSMNPMFNVFGCVLLIVPEWKPVGDKATYDNNAGIKLVTATNRRNGPSCVDSKIHHCNMINNILPKIQANLAGVADALMLDAEGFVSETNATNVFMVKSGVVYTPLPDYCLPGITRRTVISLVHGMPGVPDVIERRISLAEFHSADEVFTTGTMGELTPVVDIDGRKIGLSKSRKAGERKWPMTDRIQSAYRILTESEGVPIPSAY